MTLYETYRSWSDVLPPNALPTFLQSGGTINVSGGLSLQTKVGSLRGAIRGTRISYSKAAPLNDGYEVDLEFVILSAAGRA